MIIAPCFTPNWRFMLLFILLLWSFGNSDLYADVANNNNIVKVRSLVELQDLIKDNDFVFTFYYSSSGCGNCDNAMPFYIDAANQLAGFSSPVVFAAVDQHMLEAEDTDKMKSEMRLRSFFTLRIYQGSPNEFKPYMGPKYKEGMAEVIRSMRLGEDDVEVMTNQKIKEMQEKEQNPEPTAAEPKDSRVIILTANNFDKVVAAHPVTLVKFYAPWCGHCKKMAPAFQAAAAELADTNALLAKVDMTQPENKVFSERYGVKSFPTLKLFKGNPEAPEDYRGARTQESLVSVARRVLSGETQDGPASQKKPDSTPPQPADSKVKVLTAADFDETVASHRLTLVKFYAPWCGHCKKMAPAYEAAATELADLDGAVLAKVDMTQPENKVFSDRYGVKGFPTLKLFRGDPDAPEAYQGARTQDSLVSVTRRVFSGEAQVDPASQKREKKADPTPPEPADSKVKVLTAADFDETFALIKVVDLRIRGSRKKWRSSGFEYGEVAKHKVSLVKFYAPWCGHCKKMAPAFQAAAAELADIEDALLAKVDMTQPENRVFAERYGVKGYPTLKVFRGDPETPEAYQGARTQESIIAVVRRQLAVHGEVHSEL